MYTNVSFSTVLRLESSNSELCTNTNSAWCNTRHYTLRRVTLCVPYSSANSKKSTRKRFVKKQSSSEIVKRTRETFNKIVLPYLRSPLGRPPTLRASSAATLAHANFLILTSLTLSVFFWTLLSPPCFLPFHSCTPEYQPWARIKFVSLASCELTYRVFQKRDGVFE